MRTEVSTIARRAQVHAALADPARLAVVDRLVLGDVSPGELRVELGLAGNLLAHHLKVLERVGLVARARSEGDHRRTYLRLLPEPLSGLLPAAVVEAERVVFVCGHNSARSQLASALWTRHSRVPTASAGIEPARSVHPLAVATAGSHGLTLAERPHHVDEVLREDDLVVAVCDNAHEQLPAGDRLHWSIPDPAASDSPAAFAAAFQELADRITRLAPAVRPADPRGTASHLYPATVVETS
jgi:ArsR family transcriptional regulator, arsenate/arsenite/antimonite-responsive transcriptional repressor / arsenate reductase (thioredoxin)